MTEKEKAIRQIKEIAQELTKEDGIDYDIFSLAHPRCRTTKETGLKTGIVESGFSKGYPAKKLVCKKHNVSSQWVHVDY